MHRAMQSGLTTFALLFKAQINPGKDSIGVRDVVNGKPAEQHVASTPVSRPVQSAQNRVVERPASQARVIANLNLAHGTGANKFPSPPCVSLYGNSYTARDGAEGKLSVEWCVGVSLSLTDPIANIAL